MCLGDKMDGKAVFMGLHALFWARKNLQCVWSALNERTICRGPSNPPFANSAWQSMRIA
jgi:hypothetical protein